MEPEFPKAISKFAPLSLPVSSRLLLTPLSLQAAAAEAARRKEALAEEEGRKAAAEADERRKAAAAEEEKRNNAAAEEERRKAEAAAAAAVSIHDLFWSVAGRGIAVQLFNPGRSFDLKCPCCLPEPSMPVINARRLLAAWTT